VCVLCVCVVCVWRQKMGGGVYIVAYISRGHHRKRRIVSRERKEGVSVGGGGSLGEAGESFDRGQRSTSRVLEPPHCNTLFSLSARNLPVVRCKKVDHSQGEKSMCHVGMRCSHGLVGVLQVYV